jgi:tetratricopeptide (TPR) repeat protein
MGSSSLLKSVACLGILVAVWGCARTAESHGRASSETQGVRELGSWGGNFKAISSTGEWKQLRSALRAFEKKHENREKLPSATVIELARLCFVVGEAEGKVDRKSYFEKGRWYAELLSRREPARVEGHYWLALNLCGIAENSRPREALCLIPVIVGELELAISLDEAYEQGGAHRAIGRIYSEAPGWPLSEGDLGKSLAHLRRAVEIAPENSTNHLYLAETLIQLGKIEEARSELDRVFTSAEHSPLSNGLKDDRLRAARLIGDLGEQ